MAQTIPQHKPELLAPAGDLASALIAFDCGADAVYAGLKRFNARERTSNFTLEEMSKLVAYARRHERRVYITFNTLVKERELDDAAVMLADIADLMPDAVIVQDLGILRMLRTYFPRLPVHASTQMGTHNSAAVNLLGELGVERVILQRQIPLQELRELVRASNVEIEVFAHGALCCCLSGACLFSSWMGGWSGNRGKCKQPCRRRYFTDDGNGFFFSTRDLYTLDMLDELAGLGVSGLKIEGRLQKPDYVESVVTAYRMMLDADPAERRHKLGEARNVLTRSLGRRWSHGFLTPEAAANVIEPDRPGASGRLVGRVAEVKSNGFTISVSKSVHRGDRIRIQPTSAEEGPALTVTRLTVDQQQVSSVTPGKTCFIHCDKEIPADGLVYKIGRAMDALKERIAELPPARFAVSVSVQVSHTGVEAAIVWPDVQEKWTFSVELPEARTQPLTAGAVEEEFRKTLRDDLFVVEVAATVQGSLFVQNKLMRQARRSFWDWAGGVLEQMDPERRPGGGGLNAFRSDRLPPTKAVEFPAPDVDPRASWKGANQIVVRLDAGQELPIQGALAARPLEEYSGGEYEVVLSDFCAEQQLPVVRRHLEQAMQRGLRRVRVCSLWGLALLREIRHSQVKMTASFPLPIANSEALRLLQEHGVYKATAWVELEKEALEDLMARGQGAVEVFAFGRLPLLTTRATLPVTGDVSDARGNHFAVLGDHGGLTRILPAAPLALPVPAGCNIYLDISHAQLDEQPTSLYNYERELA